MSEARRIRVLLVDDHAMLRRGLVSFLSVYNDLELVGEAGSGAEAIRMCGHVQPDVVLMDIMLPDMSGIEATRAIRVQAPQTRVLGLTSFTDPALVQRMLAAGAIGYLLKSIDADDLAAAIRAAGRGQATLAAEAVAALLDSGAHVPGLGSELTTREREVLALMVRGLSNNMIAKQLLVSRSTIKGHVSNILAKLAVSSRTAAVALAVRLNLINHCQEG